MKLPLDFFHKPSFGFFRRFLAPTNGERTIDVGPFFGKKTQPVFTISRKALGIMCDIKFFIGIRISIYRDLF